MTPSLHPVPFTHAQRKVVADILPNLANRLKLAEKASRTFSFSLDELQSIQQKAHKAIRHTFSPAFTLCALMYSHQWETYWELA